MSKKAKRNTRAATTPTQREIERRAARLALQRDVRQERQIQVFARQLRREMVKSDEALINLAHYITDQFTDPEPEQTIDDVKQAAAPANV